MWSLKYGTDAPVYKTETDQGHREQTSGCQREERREFGVGGYKLAFGVDGQWTPTVQHRELCVIRSLCCTTETEEIL